jgi:hypothetical protein
MGRGIFAEDFACLCLWLGNYDLNASMQKIIKNSEKIEEKQSACFGADTGDFEGALYDMTLKAVDNFKTDINYDNETENFKNITLKDLLPTMLNYQDIYWNDADTCWSTGDIEQTESTELKTALTELLKKPDKKEVRKLLDRYHFTEDKVAFYITCRNSKMYNSANIMKIDHFKDISEIIKEIN